jgi:hypothetical protein
MFVILQNSINHKFNLLGDEIWLVYGAVPNDISVILLNTQNDKGISQADIAISQKDIKFLNKPTKQCKIYDKSPQSK